jgi:hypothetical protein
VKGGDPVDFQTALREQCVARGGHAAHHILHVLDMPDSPRKTRIIARLEGHARTHLVEEGAVGAGVEAIDWGSIDWAKFFDGLIKLLSLILPLFIH